jgi:leader peptidase (prepilin peptidase) / N-methyltransferase
VSWDAMFNPQYWDAVPFHFWSVVFFVFGSIVGSFLNVCIYRMPLELSVVNPPSHCPHCKYAIPFYLNVPLLTWLSLGGRCKNCRAPISPRYFIVELLTGLTFLACWLTFGHASPWIALVYCLFLAGLITATFIDFEHFIIPDEITLGGAVVGFVISLLLPSLHGVTTVKAGLWQSALGIAVGGGIVYAVLRMGKLLFGKQKIKLPPDSKIVFSETALCLPDEQIPYEEFFYRKSDTIIFTAKNLELIDRSYPIAKVRLSPSELRIDEETFSPESVPHLEAKCSEITVPREAMGLGDVKFMAGIGAFLGWQGALFALMASSFIGAAVGIILIVSRKREVSKIPYGPYIALGAAIWVFGGKDWAATWIASFYP